MRKCKFNLNYISKEDFDKTWEEGLFHQWGSDYEEFESGPGNYSIAIVENSEGKVHTVTPDCVVFLDSPKEDN